MIIVLEIIMAIRELWFTVFDIIVCAVIRLFQDRAFGRFQGVVFRLVGGQIVHRHAIFAGVGAGPGVSAELAVA